MNTPIITFDVDGVLAGGGYIPEMERKPEVYERLPLLDPNAPQIINDLTRKYSVYIVSSRHFPGALDTTRLWLNEQGVYLSWLCGVICVAGAKQKIKMIDLLGSDVHVDDSPEVLDSVDAEKVLFLGAPKQFWWPAAKTGSYSEDIATCKRWEELPGVIERLLF